VKAAQEMSAPMSTAALGPSGAKPGPAGAQAAGQESALWAVLASAADAREYCQSWLAIQCRLIPGVLGGVVLLRLPGARVTPPSRCGPTCAAT
jgi:hypothetical protein